VVQVKGFCRRCHVEQDASNSYIHRKRGFWQSYCIACGKIIGDWGRSDKRAERIGAWLTKYLKEKAQREMIL
jgi:hypothetical protein